VRLAWRVVEFQVYHYRRTWQSSVVGTVVFPVLALLVLGIGVDRLIGASDALGGIRYLDFVAPAVLAGTAMQVAATEATMPIFVGLRLTRTAEAMLATPIGPSGLVDGHLLWICLRTATASLVLFGLSAWLGVFTISTLVPVLGICLLVALAHAGPLLAYSVRQDTAYGLVAISRLFVLPMMLGAGTLAPVDLMPPFLAYVARATPLWHGAQLCRAAAGATMAAWTIAVHVGYLLAWAGIGYAFARRTFNRRLGL